MHALGQRGARRQVQHVAVAQQCFRAGLVEDGARVDLELTWKAIRVGMLALIRPVITSTDGRCVARIRWMPAARAFCARRAISSSTFLPTIIIMSANSSMKMTMNGSVSSGRGASPSSGFGEQRIHQRLARVLRFLHLLVEAGQVAHAHRAHQLVAALHLGHAPAQAVGASFMSVTTGASRCGCPGKRSVRASSGRSSASAGLSARP